MGVRLREMTTDEITAVHRLAQSRTAAARSVERARIIGQAAQGQAVRTIATQLHRNAQTVRLWVKRFNATGLAGLDDQPRSGRPTTYPPEEVSEVVAAALTHPQALDLPFGSWTLDRLEVYLNEVKGIRIKRSRIDELLLAEGLRWRTQETWFGERAGVAKSSTAAGQLPSQDHAVDPAFARKRGQSRRSTPSHPLAV
jgi:transposase